MTSWVRYSVAVYVGLLLAGALVVPRPEAVANGDPAGARLSVVDPASGIHAAPTLESPPNESPVNLSAFEVNAAGRSDAP